MTSLRKNRSVPLIKICGLTSTEQAQAIAAMGADAIGVIGVEATPRFVEAATRRQLFQELERSASRVRRVWVVANPDDTALAEALAGSGTPNVVQLHGGETPEQCKRLKALYPQVEWWKALRVRESEHLNTVETYAGVVDALLLDAWSPDQLGGTGHRLPLEWLEGATLPWPWWLAGGIDAEWIPELLNQVRPYGVDASSRLETCPGVKNLEKVKALLQAIKG